MSFSIVPRSAIACLSLSVLLAGCGGARLQSFERFSEEATQSTHRADKQGCARHADSSAYLECVKRNDQAYGQLKNEREKAAKSR